MTSRCRLRATTAPTSTGASARPNTDVVSAMADAPTPASPAATSSITG